MTREEAIAEAIRQGCSAVDAKAVGSALPEDCSFRTPGWSAPAIIVNRCGMLARARANFDRALLEFRDALVEVKESSYATASPGHTDAVHRLASADDELAECRERLEDLQRDYGLETT